MRTLTWMALTSAAVVVTSCGGLSRKQLTGKADGICARFTKQAAALGAPDLAEADKARAYFTKAGALARRQQGELEALEPDGDVQSDYEKLTTAMERATRVLPDLANASGEQDRPRYAALVQRLQATSADVDTAAKDLGATACAG